MDVRRKILTLSTLYRILVSQCPPYLHSKYRYRTEVSSRTTRSHDLLLDIPQHNTEFYAKSFLIASMKLWNVVPYSILNSVSPFSFKISLEKAVSEGLLSS